MYVVNKATESPFNNFSHLQVVFAQSFKSNVELCKFHGSAVGCKYGHKCLYSHKNPHSIRICPQYQKHGKCPHGNKCAMRHLLPSKPVFFIDPDNITYDSSLVFILEKDIESKSVIIELFDYTKYINYYDQAIRYKQLFGSSFTILSDTELNTMNNKYIFLISHWFREAMGSEHMIWPNQLSHFMLKTYFQCFLPTQVPITAITNTNNSNGGAPNVNNICTVIHLEPVHKYYICMKTIDESGFVSSAYSDIASFETKPFEISEPIIFLYCKAFEAFISLTEKSYANRIKLWHSTTNKECGKQEVDIIVRRIVFRFLSLFCERLEKSRIGMTIPSIYNQKIAENVLIRIKELLPEKQSCVISKVYFEQHIVSLLRKVSLRQVFCKAF